MGSERDYTVEDFLKEWNDGNPWIEAATSGSTGTPKKIRLLKDDMRASAMATCRRFGIDNSSTLHLPLSPAYIAGKMMVVRAEVSGAKLLVEAPSRTPLASIPSGIDRIALSAIVPSQIEGLLASPCCSIIDNVIIGGAPIDAAREEAIAHAPFEAYATYGMTETCSHVALRSITRGEDRFTAMPGLRFETDDRGCLVVIAPDFSFGRLVTNDIVELHSDTTFTWLGRHDNVINSGGIKIHPEQIEAALKKNLPKTVTDLAVTSETDSEWGEAVTLVAESNEKGCIEELKALCKNTLTRYMVPKRIAVIAQLPRTANGKIDRNGLRTLLRQGL